MWQLDEDAARAQWASAAPFPHAIVDGAAADAGALLGILEDVAVERYEGEIALFDASAPEPEGELARVRDAFAAAYAPAFSRITGKPVTRVDMRAYAYHPGHYLLPHTDHQDGLARVLAYAYYLPSPEPPAGGELELFACAMAGDEIVSVAPGRIIAPQANRLVVFDVGAASLHRVCEVLEGVRLSLAGWFYA